jgi:PAS domain S-box-containing protein
MLRGELKTGIAIGREAILYLIIAFTAAFAAALPQTCLAAAPLILSADTLEQSLSGRMDVLEDKGGQLDIAEVAAPGQVAAFRPLPHYLAAGYSRSAFWLRFTLRREAGGPGERLLAVDLPNLDHVDLYSPDGADGFRVVKTGDRLPFATRPVAHRNFVFRLYLPQGQAQTFYLRVQTTSAVVVKAKVWEPQAFAETAAAMGAFLGLIHGIMIFISIFGLIVYMGSRQDLYLNYTLYIIFFEILFAGMNGYTAQFLFPAMPAMSDALVSLGVCVTIGASMFLASPILGVEKRHPRLHRIYRILGYASYGGAVTVPLGLYWLIGFPLHVVTIFGCVAQLISAAGMAVRGERAGLSYLAAFGVQLLAFILLSLRNIGLLGGLEGIDLASQVGGVLHIVLLTLGLARRVAGIEREKRSTQVALLEASQRHERELEARVAERTAALKSANDDLAAEVAERQAAEARLRESEAHLRALLDAAPFPMLVTSMPGGRLLFLNRPAEDLLGLAPGAGIGVEVSQFYADHDQRVTLIARLTAERVVAGVELQARRSDGQRRWVMVSAVHFRYGTDDASMVCLSDITARKELEQTLVDARERSEAALVAQSRAMREQRNFLALVSHEFRTPLAIIGAAVDVLDLKMPDVAGDRVAKIHRAILRLTGLIDTLLADEWLDATMEGLRLQAVDLCAMLADLKEERAPIAPHRLVLRPPAEAVEIEGDPVLLRVLFSNLIDNAVKYSPSDGEIRIAVAGGDDRVAVTVADDGPGISPGDEQYVFEKFYRGKGVTDRGGAGLGLHLVKRIVERHRGTVTLDSGAGKGASFTIILPRGQDGATPQGASRMEPQGPAYGPKVESRAIETERKCYFPA